jgi:hypothetical protein
MLRYGSYEFQRGKQFEVFLVLAMGHLRTIDYRRTAFIVLEL